MLLGAGVGASSVAVPVYVAETAPAALRGALGSVTQLAVTVGILLAYVAGALAPHESLEYACGPARRGAARGAWRSLALVGAVLGGGVVGVALNRCSAGDAWTHDASASASTVFFRALRGSSPLRVA